MQNRKLISGRPDVYRKCLKPIKLKYPRQKLKAIKDLVIEPVNINNRKRKKTKTDTEASKRRKKGKGLDSVKFGQSLTVTVYSDTSQNQVKKLI